MVHLVTVADRRLLLRQALLATRLQALNMVETGGAATRVVAMSVTAAQKIETRDGVDLRRRGSRLVWTGGGTPTRARGDDRYINHVKAYDMTNGWAVGLWTGYELKFVQLLVVV